MSDVELCPWCPHSVASHSDYYGGWCAADVLVIDALSDGSEVPYNYSCWCGGTEETKGPRIVVSTGDIHLVPAERFANLPAWRPEK